MPAWGLQILLALIPILHTLVERFVPNMFSRKKEFKAKKRVMKRLVDVHAMTVAEIARLRK